MSQTASVYEFEARDARGSLRSGPTTDEFAKIVSQAEGPVALVRADFAQREDLASAATDADVTVVVADAAAATGGRGAADLAGALWQSFPAVAALLCESLIDVGAVIFSPAGLKRLTKTPYESGDPLGTGFAEVLSNGGSIKAVLLPGSSDAALPTDPPTLVPSPPSRQRSWLRQLIQQSEPKHLLGRVSSTSDAVGVLSGLLLWHDFLDESHKLSQSIEGVQSGDYWHAIMHRREGDYGNSKYWFRRVGKHPVFESLASRGERLASGFGPAGERLLARLIADGAWDPMAFVDACSEATRSSDGESDRLLRIFQADEMLLLLWQTCLDARG